jgi:hypothetical protein
MEWARIIAERQIKEAMDNGEFEGNPLQGKPIDLTEDMSLPPEQRIAAKILKNAGVLPDWAQAERDILREKEEIASLRERGLKSFSHAHTTDLRGRIAARLKRDLPDRMKLVNTLILRYNMTAPAGYVKSFATYNIKEELATLERELAP